MKRDLFNWSLAIVVSLSLMVSISHADAISVRSLLGLAEDATSVGAPVCQFALNRSDCGSRALNAEDRVLFPGNDSSAVYWPETHQILKLWTSSDISLILLVISLETTSWDSNSGNFVMPATALQRADHALDNRQITVIVLETRAPAPAAPQTQAPVLRLVGPQFTGSQNSGDTLLFPGYSESIPIARARGPVK
jgi:hypothetical protein